MKTPVVAIAWHTAFLPLIVLKCAISCVYVLCVVYVLLVLYEVAHSETCPVSLRLPPHAGCNRDSRLCDRKFNRVAFATMHNAFASTQSGFLVAQHRGCIQSALLSGVRAFMLDVHLARSGDIFLCHVSCTLGSSSVSATLELFRQFMQHNPREIVTIFWEFGYDMRDKSSTQHTAALRKQLNDAMSRSQLNPLVHAQRYRWCNRTHIIPAGWPMLQTMISSQKRLVMFTHSSHTEQDTWETSIDDYTTQTSFQMQDVTEMQDGCDVGRWEVSHQLLVMNHFTALGALGVSGGSTSILSILFHMKFFANINQNPFLAKRILSCMLHTSSFPSFVAVDYWESSDVLGVVDMINTNFYHANTSSFSATVMDILNSTVTDDHEEIQEFIIRQPPTGQKDDYDSENSWISHGLPSSGRRMRRGDGR